jgi:hypothetical protein
MNLMTETFRFTFLTPCFSGTAEGKNARESELRVPPIRGQIRFWHRAAFGVESANRIWGSTGGNEGQGSRVAISIDNRPTASRETAPLLPHKSHGQGARPALPEGAEAVLKLLRLPPCTDDEWTKALGAAKLWLVAGTLGYRGSRAAGSVWPLAPWAPASPNDLARILAPLIAKPAGAWAAALVAGSSGKDSATLRKTASDTTRGRAHLFGSAQPRQPSPVRFKVVSLQAGLGLMAVAPSNQALAEAESVLKSKPDPRRWSELGSWNPLR